VSLAERLHVAAETGISFHDWMDACLYDPEEGYYMRAGRKTGAGKDADFATSPTLHPFMGTAIGKQIAAVFNSMAQPDDFMVVEFGGGEGDLARAATAELKTAGHVVPWLHVEKSPGHRDAQAGAGFTHGPLPDSFCGVVVAHEFLDALPVHLMERRLGHWAEIYVRMANGVPRLETGFPTQVGTDAAPMIDPPEGQRVAANPAAKAWFTDVGNAMSAGAVIVVDYGDEAEKLWNRDPEMATIRTFAHQADGGDPLEGPGQKDITASIDFAQLRGWAADAGLTEVGYDSQEEFLIGHGALEAMNEIDRNTVAGASTYLRMRQLVLPTAMGQAFRVARYEKGMG
jgi:SAM-dependent MidA family methyltransferase